MNVTSRTVRSAASSRVDAAVERAREFTARKKRQYETAWATGDRMAAKLMDDESAEETRTLRSGQMSNQFTMMVQVAVTLAVGVLIVGEIFNALPDSGALSNASTAVENQTGTAFELAPIVLIVVVASLVIGVVRRI
jgi:hypothetical protein